MSKCIFLALLSLVTLPSLASESEVGGFLSDYFENKENLIVQLHKACVGVMDNNAGGGDLYLNIFATHSLIDTENKSRMYESEETLFQKINLSKYTKNSKKNKLTDKILVSMGVKLPQAEYIEFKKEARFTVPINDLLYELIDTPTPEMSSIATYLNLGQKELVKTTGLRLSLRKGLVNFVNAHHAFLAPKNGFADDLTTRSEPENDLLLFQIWPKVATFINTSPRSYANEKDKFILPTARKQKDCKTASWAYYSIGFE